MKKSIFLIAFLINAFLCSGQITYPRIETDSLGQKVVIMTIEQAQKLDNSSDLLVLFEKLDEELGNYDKACIEVINKQGQVITSQEIEIGKLKELVQVKDKQIDILQRDIAAYIAKEKLFEQELVNLQKISNEYKVELGKQKLRSVIGGSASGLAIIGLIVTLILVK